MNERENANVTLIGAFKYILYIINYAPNYLI